MIPKIYYIYILATVLFTFYGQIILKWRIARYGSLPEGFTEKVYFLFKVLFDPFILSGFSAAFVASFFWMAAMTKIPLSVGYPFTALSFVLVLVFSNILLGESLSAMKVMGTLLVVAGIVVASQG
ncbi:MAG: EamA family transporter [Leptospiraceae bacterium]|nr:EamA family transporter [Leptospiraceae bacterium]